MLRAYKPAGVRCCRTVSALLCDDICMQVNINPLVLLSNAAAAFGLNMSVFLLIGKTSALTMNVAGVIKDWLLIGLSVLIFQAQVCAPALETTAGSWEYTCRPCKRGHQCK